MLKCLDTENGIIEYELKSTKSHRIIVKVAKDGVVVACGDQHGLKLTDLQLSGKKRMDVASLLNGSHPFEVGKQFN